MSEELDLHSAPRVGSETFQRLASMSLRSTSEAATSAVSFRGVERHFGAVKAVDGVDLDIRPGEFFAMLGPSGSGKTTCLRLIGGFDQPTAGSIEIFGEAVEGVPVYRRPVNTVFQDYALFPHMNVLENVCYGLMIRGMDRAERRRLGVEALQLVKLVGLEARKPGELSGGQRQRVALARALVLRPKVLLLDEPLGALDLKLREAMQGELRSLQRSLGLTFVFVTHDQGEALSMADRVAVFNHGRVVQVGTPEEIYERPKSRFVADFVGGSNVIEPALVKAWIGVERAASVRPEKIALIDADAPATADFIVLDGRVAQVLYHGAVSRIELVTAEAGRLFLTIPSTVAPPQQGVAARISFSRYAVHFMEPE
jgi:putative spermidine/putrescine transport system ATP-binding protein